MRKLVVVLLAGALCFFIYQAVVTAGALNGRVESKEMVEQFLDTENTDGFSNQKAAELFGQKPPKPAVTNALYSYKTPIGFTMDSYSAKWDTEKLKLLYAELLRNKHGDEIAFLSEIKVYAEADEYAAATHQNEEKQITFGVKFPSLPTGFALNFSRTTGVICLYDGDRNTTVESMARSLSHEYGHHYTLYYMFDDETVGESEYARLRGLGDKGRTDMTDYSDYLKNHQWYLAEIAAEDYLNILGSPAARRTVQFYDVNDVLYGARQPWVNLANAWNADPQENIHIPLTAEVSGLRNYFYSFLGEEAPASQGKQTVTLSITPGSAFYNLETGPKTFYHYQITWNTPYSGATYTLVYLDGDYYMPIRTTKGGSAYIGTMTSAQGGMIHSTEDRLDRGAKTFYVIATFPDGTAYRSSPLSYTF